MGTDRIVHYKKIGTAVLFVVMLVLVAAPVGCLVLEAVAAAPLQGMEGVSLAKILLNSIGLGGGVVLVASALAVPLAWILAKTDFCRYHQLDILLLIPFMTPPYISAMGWILFMQKGGYLEQLLPIVAPWTPGFFSFGGMVWIMSLQSAPFLFLLLRNTIIEVSAGKEEAALVHGGSLTYNLRRFFLPLLLSGYVLGAFLIFVKTIAEFGIPATFGRLIGYPVFTTEIYRYLAHWPIDFGKAALLASVLLSASLLLWALQTLVSRRFSYPLVGGKNSRAKIYHLSGKQKAGAWLYVGGFLFVAVGIPYFSIVSTSLLKLQGAGLAWGNLTTDNYIRLLSWGSDSLQALINSFGFSLCAATLAAILGTGLALVIHKSDGVFEQILDFLGMLPNTLPGMVFVVGLILMWDDPQIPIPLYNTAGMVVLTYVILCLPYPIQYVKAIYTRLGASLLEAGQMCGGKPLFNFLHILLPLILPEIVAGWVMAFAFSFRELVASLMILPPAVETSATYIFSQFEQGETALGMAMAVVSVGLTTGLLLLINRLIPGERRNG